MDFNCPYNYNGYIRHIILQSIMIVDENLKDCSNRIIANLKSENIKLKRNLGICIGITIVSIFLVVYAMFVCNHQDKLLHRLTIQLEQDEQILSLEYSIGYWFINKPEEVNDSVLLEFLIENKAWYPEILLRQAKIESGNYSSNVYKNSNNLYGMRRVRSRQTTQTSTYNGYGVYNNWCLSALDRLLWDIFYFDNKKPSEEEYLNAMGIYAEDSNYKSKLK